VIVRRQRAGAQASATDQINPSMPLRSLYRCTNMHIFSSKARTSVAQLGPNLIMPTPHVNSKNKETFFAASARVRCQQILAESQHLLRAAAPPPQGIEAMGVQGSIFRQQEVHCPWKSKIHFFFFFAKRVPPTCLARTQSRRALCSLLADDDDDDSQASGWSFKFDSTISGKAPRGNFNRLKLP
jgi:hypothetical protein